MNIVSNRFFYFSIVIFLSCTKIATAQCENMVTHLSDTATINNVLVTVSSSGVVSAVNGFCLESEPYFVGNDQMGNNENGSYTFHFSPPIDFLSLNFTGIHNFNNDFEIIKLFVNGEHYSIPSIDNLNICDDSLAILTSLGNMTASFNEVAGGGTKDLSISGSISSLTVMDSIVSGVPNGATFSLSICDGIPTSTFENNNLDIEVFPNPASNKLTITGLNQAKLNIELYDILGHKLRIDSISKLNEIEIDVSTLTEGLYFLVISKNGIYENHKIVITRNR